MKVLLGLRLAATREGVEGTRLWCAELLEPDMPQPFVPNSARVRPEF